MTPERAETLALQALAYIAQDDTLMPRLLALTGLGPDDLKTAVDKPETLAGVMDFLLQDEKALLAFCEAVEIAPEDPARARSALPGGDLPHYT